MRKISILLLSALLLVSCSHSNKSEEMHGKKMAIKHKQEIPASFVPRNLTIVSAGDSLTQGVGGSKGKEGYLKFLELRLENLKGINEVDFYNFGVSGSRTPQLLKRLQLKEVKTAVRSADIVILTIGGNDIMKVVKENISNLQLEKFNQEKWVFLENLERIINEIRVQNSEAAIVLVGLYNPFEKWFSNVKEMDTIINSWNDESRKVIAKNENAYFVEVSEIFADSEESLLYKDYFHPNDKGYSLIADTLYKQISRTVLSDLDEPVFSAKRERE